MVLLEKKVSLPDFGNIEIVRHIPARGHASVYKVMLQTGEHAALKLSGDAIERGFYETCAGHLRAYNVHSPDLLWSGKVQGQNAILIEWFHEMLPKTKWRNDPGIFKYLAKLHSIPIPEFNDPALHGWRPELTFEAMTYFNGSEKLKMESVLEKMRLNFQYLFEPRAVLHGDPCGPNWGITTAGDLALFDWERFGRGHPAIDLAAVSFWQLTRKEFENLAELYLSVRPDLDWGKEKLATEIQIARVHTVLVILSNQYKGIGDMPAQILRMFQNEYPNWLLDIDL